jgi:NCS1 family nucleobase:cation symporter-1
LEASICEFPISWYTSLVLIVHSFAIGYIYSFLASGIFYWGLMKWFPHRPSQLDYAITGEDIIAASDEKAIASGERKVQRSIWDLMRGKTARRASVV